jgi:hypothetical protein
MALPEAGESAKLSGCGNESEDKKAGTAGWENTE